MTLINPFYYLLSYLFPYVIYEEKGKLSEKLQVKFDKGRLTFGTPNTNYSYGDHHRFLLKKFQKFKIKERGIGKVLVLGFGTGSAASILKEYYKKDCVITAVENDPIVISIGEKYFNTKRFKGLNLICSDAYDYIVNCNETYDLIIVDVLVEDEVPGHIETAEFISGVNKIISAEGIIFYNRVVTNSMLRQKAALFQKRFNEIMVKSEIAVFSIKGVKKWVLAYDKKIISEGYYHKVSLVLSRSY